jgi:hypothetical protein
LLAGCFVVSSGLGRTLVRGRFPLPDRFGLRLQSQSFDGCTCEVRFLEVFAASGKLGVPHTAGYN